MANTTKFDGIGEIGDFESLYKPLPNPEDEKNARQLEKLNSCGKPKKMDACKNSEYAKLPASEVCKKIEKESDNLGKQIAEGMKYVIPIVGIISALKTDSESTQNLINKLSSDLDSKSIAVQTSQCATTTMQSQTNILKAGISPNCMRMLIAGRWPPDKVIELQKASRISDVIQTNKADATNTCQINLVLDVLTKMDASIDNTILQKAMNKAKGFMAGAKSDQNICNDISVKMSACKYIEQTQCCANLINQTQLNLIDSQCGASLKTVLQNNEASAVNNCQLQASASVTDDLAADIKNALAQTAENTAEGLTFDFWIIFVVIGVVMFGGFAYCMRYMMNNALYILGAILIVAGIITMIVYFAKAKPSETRYNEPYSTCEGIKALKSSLDRSTFGKVKERVKNSDVIGYDFFIDVDTENDQLPEDIIPSKITDDQTGTVLYITVEPNNNCKFDPPDKPRNAVVSHIRTRRKKGILICSIILILGGIGSIIGGVIKARMLAPKTATVAPSTDSAEQLKPTASNFLSNISSMKK